MVDKLSHVKEFFVSVALDGFGVRRFVANERLSLARKYFQEHAVPRLYLAIAADDPKYDPQGKVSAAKTTEAVRAYVAELERDKQFLERYDPGGDLFHLLFQPSQNGCFHGALVEALKADDPEWRPDDPENPA